MQLSLDRPALSLARGSAALCWWRPAKSMKNGKMA